MIEGSETVFQLAGTRTVLNSMEEGSGAGQTGATREMGVMGRETPLAKMPFKLEKGNASIGVAGMCESASLTGEISFDGYRRGSSADSVRMSCGFILVASVDLPEKVRLCRGVSEVSF